MIITAMHHAQVNLRLLQHNSKNKNYLSFLMLPIGENNVKISPSLEQCVVAQEKARGGQPE